MIGGVIAAFTSGWWKRWMLRLVKIVDAIDKQDLWKNTVVIFTSDHGDGMGAHHWNQKSALYEEVVNVPLIVTLPGKKNAGKEMPPTY